MLEDVTRSDIMVVYGLKEGGREGGWGGEGKKGKGTVCGHA
jgi:hypothetical protein